MIDFLTQEYLFLVGPTAVLSLALAAVAVSYVFLLIRLGKSEKDKVFLQSKIRDQASEILMEAHEKRLKIIHDALIKSGEIVRDTQAVGLDVKSQLASDIQDMRKKQMELLIQRREQISKLYDEFEESLRKDTSEQFKIVAKNMEGFALEGIKEFRTGIENEKVDMYKHLSIKMDEEIKRIQKDVDEYKMDQIKKIDKKVFDILQALTRDILGKSLTLKDHEELVQKALVQMKVDMNSEI